MPFFRIFVCKLFANFKTQIMITTKFYLDIRSEKIDGTFPVKINITNNRKTFFINTGLSSKKIHWENNQFTSDEPNFRAKNVKLRDIMNKIEKVIFSLEEAGKANSIDNLKLKDLILRKLTGKQESMSFISCLDEFVSLKSNQGTIKIYQHTRNKVNEFDGLATFDSITKEWILKFEKWLLETGCKINTISIHQRNIRAVFNYAIDNEYTSSYPFRRFTIKKEETAKRSLSIDELRKLRDYPVEEYQEKYRDIFMLMFYLMGINAADLFNLPPLTGDKITYHRAKTNRLYEIKVEPEAKNIIKKYKGQNFMLNVLDDYKNYKDFLHRMNIGLQKIGEVKREGRGGKKIITPLFPKLSSYWARHTWATIAAGLDIPKETISAALGHSTNSVTDIYIKFDNRKIDAANRRVIDVLNSTDQ